MEKDKKKCVQGSFPQLGKRQRTMGSLRREKHHFIPSRSPQVVASIQREKESLYDLLRDPEGWTEAPGHSGLADGPTHSPTHPRLALSRNAGSLDNK